MSDVVDRLRSAFKAWGLRSLGDEAADEIERLTQRIEDLQAVVAIASATCGKSNCNCVGAKRVRDAVEEVRG